MLLSVSDHINCVRVDLTNGVVNFLFLRLIGFLEYLMDRKTEADKAGKEQKHELIVELVRSPFSKEVFEKPFHLRLREYEREGPFYVRAQAAVAFEGAD